MTSFRNMEARDPDPSSTSKPASLNRRSDLVYLVRNEVLTRLTPSSKAAASMSLKRSLSRLEIDPRRPENDIRGSYLRVIPPGLSPGRRRMSGTAAMTSRQGGTPGSTAVPPKPVIVRCRWIDSRPVRISAREVSSRAGAGFLVQMTRVWISSGPVSSRIPARSEGKQAARSTLRLAEMTFFSVPPPMKGSGPPPGRTRRGMDEGRCTGRTRRLSASLASPGPGCGSSPRPGVRRWCPPGGVRSPSRPRS